MPPVLILMSFNGFKIMKESCCKNNCAKSIALMPTWFLAFCPPAPLQNYFCTMPFWLCVVQVTSTEPEKEMSQLLEKNKKSEQFLTHAPWPNQFLVPHVHPPCPGMSPSWAQKALNFVFPDSEHRAAKKIRSKAGFCKKLWCRLNPKRACWPLEPCNLMHEFHTHPDRVHHWL